MSAGPRPACRPRLPPARVVQLESDDPWLDLQRYLLRQAEDAGDDRRAAFYRALLRGI